MADVALRCDEVFENNTGFTTEPVDIKFGDDVTVKMKTTYHFPNPNEIEIEREILAIEGSDIQELEIEEYVKGCYGIIDYPEDMKGIHLTIDGDEAHSLDYDYKRRKLTKDQSCFAEAQIPQVNSIIGLKASDSGKWNGRIEEGILFNPYYTLSLKRTLKTGNTSKICLYLKTMK